MGTSCGVHCASGLLKLTCNGGKVHLLVQSGLSTATNLAQPLHARVTVKFHLSVTISTKNILWVTAALSFLAVKMIDC